MSGSPHTQGVRILFALLCAQNGRCFYCEAAFDGPRTRHHSKPGREWTKDHLLPLAHGHGAKGNIILACGKCNAEKGDRPATPAEIRHAIELRAQAAKWYEQFTGEPVEVLLHNWSGRVLAVAGMP